jgi:hypothetical protein
MRATLRGVRLAFELNLKCGVRAPRRTNYMGTRTSNNAHTAHPKNPRPTMLPEFFPAGTEFADVQGVPVSCTRNGICRAWDRNPDRHFSIESFVYKGMIVTEASFRELHRKRRASHFPLAAQK